MSVAPQLQLAVLWPWLLMAMLQIHLDYLGLVLAAAERASAQKAIIRVVPFKLEPLTLEGIFASVADVTPAEGKLLQFHPLSLCNTSDDEHTVPGFVSIVKLESPEKDLHPCLSLANKAKLAGERGARAVLFDITDDQSAANQLRKPRGLSHPVVLIWGHDAELLMGVVNNNREANVKIEVKEPPAWADYDVWILLTMVCTVLAIISIVIVRTRCQSSRTQPNVQEQTLRAINQLATRRYQARHRQGSKGDSISTCSSAPVCAICFEEFKEGEELRIINCCHEFHRQCVDRWLQQNPTCPLCMFNINDQDSSSLPVHSREESSHNLGSGRRPHFIQPHPDHALCHFPQTLPQRPPGNCSLMLPHDQTSFNSPQLSQLDLGTIHYLPYRPLGSESWCGHPTPLPRGWLVSHHQESVASQSSCLPQPWPPYQGLKPTIATKLSRNPFPQVRRHHSSGSGESYRTEPSGYLPDGPGSDSSSGPCHGSSSDSMLNCTDVSLQAIHGSCSTFHSSLSSDYDPFAFCGSEKLAKASSQESSPSWKNPCPQARDMVGTGRVQQAGNHVHYHHHHHHHHGRHHHGRSPPDCPNDSPSQEPSQRKVKYSRPRVGSYSAQILKRTEKTNLSESNSASRDVPLTGQSSTWSRGHGPTLANRFDFSVATGGQTGAVGSWTSRDHYLQLHPPRRKWKCRLTPSQSPLLDNSGVPSGNCCSREVQPLMPSSPSPHFEDPPQASQCLVLHTSREPQKQGGRGGELNDNGTFPVEGSGTDNLRTEASFYLNCQIPQHHQGSKEDIPGIYEYSV